jgi:hypothetical protein
MLVMFAHLAKNKHQIASIFFSKREHQVTTVGFTKKEYFVQILIPR